MEKHKNFPMKGGFRVASGILTVLEDTITNTYICSPLAEKDAMSTESSSTSNGSSNYRVQ